MACALSAGAREAEYMREVERWGSDAMHKFAELFARLVEAMEIKPFYDFLGDVHMDTGYNPGSGEFYTPHELCKLMARLTFSETDDWIIPIHEPAGGSGRLILAFAEALVERGSTPLRLRAECWDVSDTASNMAFVNLTLSGIPAKIVCGDTLAMKSTWWAYNPIWVMEESPLTKMTRLIADIARRQESGETGPPPAEPIIESGPITMARDLWEAAGLEFSDH